MKRTHALCAAGILICVALLAPATALARSIPNPGPPPGPSTPPAPPLTGGLMEFLALVPDTPEARAFTVWGDPEAWARATGIGPLAGLAELDALDEGERNQWQYVMPTQTQPPDALGLHFLAQDDMAPAYGFDYFGARQTLYSGEAPNTLTVVQAGVEPEDVAEALLASGYEAQPIAGGTLYARGEDYAPDFAAPAQVGRVGALNRIALLEPTEEGESTIEIAHATTTITASAAARFGEIDSLADISDYRAIVGAIETAGPSEGALVGLTLMEGPFPNLVTLTSEPDPAVAQMLESYAKEPLSPYSTVAFATFRGEDFTELGVFLVLASGDDPSYVAQLLDERMDAYVSMVGGEKLSERWETQWIGAYEGEENIAYVTVRLKPEDEHRLTWNELIARRDLLFLTAE